MSTRILLVDDFSPFRRYVRALLRDQSPFEIVAEACDGMAGLHKAAELQPDIVLLDIGLPLLSGIEAAKRIGDHSPDSRILFMSQQISPEIIREAFRSGAWAYIIKTHVASELLPALRSIRTGAMYLSRYSVDQHKSIMDPHWLSLPSES
jgi:DNA-binding NarL/FixJ family response regulator